MNKAIEYFQQALVISREIDDRQGEESDLGNLGNAYAGLGQVGKATEYYEQALVISREIGDRRGEAICLHNIGELHKDQGNIPLARQYLEQSLVISEDIKFQPLIEESRRLLAELEGE